MGKSKIIIGLILILVGILYAAAPHSIHTGYGIGFGLDHTTHMIMGAVLIVIGLVIMWKGRG